MKTEVSGKKHMSFNPDQANNTPDSIPLAKTIKINQLNYPLVVYEINTKFHFNLLEKLNNL